jgi:hypothetical protein
MKSKGRRTITGGEYRAFEIAYEWFNGRLFGWALAPCRMTVQQQARGCGYCANKRLQHYAEGNPMHAIALDPETFAGRSDKEILSTLVHTMVHCWQQQFRKVEQQDSHNKEWAVQMTAVGLRPSHTKEMGGKQTGQSLTHSIIPGGPFDTAADTLLAQGFRLLWPSAV